MSTYSPSVIRKRKMLLVLPLLAVPFLAMAFWALGGGKLPPSSAAALEAGLKTDLPDALLKDDQGLNKLGYYERANLDSAKLRDRLKKDPYYQPDLMFPDLPELDLGDDSGNHTAATGRSITRAGSTNLSDKLNQREAEVYDKINQLNRAVQAPSSKNMPDKAFYPTRSEKPALHTDDVDRLENMMRLMEDKDAGSTDPEMDQLNGVLEKIMSIQHPEEAVVPTPPKQSTDSFYQVSPTNPGDTTTAGFYGWPVQVAELPKQGETIKAVVHADQVLKASGLIRLRLQQELYIGGVCIPSGHFLTGIGTVKKERLEIVVTSLSYLNHLYPVKISVYDLDGLPGIAIPGAAGTELTNEVVDNAMPSMTLGSLDPSFKAQAAAAGISTAKSLLTRKMKVRSVQVKAGTQLFLQNQKSRQ